MKRRLIAVPLIVATLGLTAGCGSSTKTDSQGSQQTITVFAAASLKKPFTALQKSFEASHPGIKVVFSFGGSPTLVAQVNEGAKADVLATASVKTMKGATTAVSPKVFASNVLEIAVPPSNPAHIASLSDLTRSGVKVAICQATVPCGVVAAKVLANAKVTLTPATEETDVTAVLTKVSLNEVDAGLVYVTDVRGDSSVKGIEIPAAENSVTTYPIAILKGSGHAAAAQEFIDYILGSAGQATLASQGWGKP